MSDKLVDNFMVYESFILNVLLFLLIILNYIKSRDKLLKSSFFALLIYSVASLIYSLFILPLNMEDRVNIHFIFFTLVPAISGVGLFYINRKNSTVIMLITILLLSLEALVTYTIYIDRSIVAMSGVTDISVDRVSTEVLWSIRNLLSTSNNVTLVLALFLPRIYLVNTYDNNAAHRILLDVEKYLSRFDSESHYRLKAKAYLDLGEQGLLDISTNNQKSYHFEVGTHLLNQAIKICCYEPGRENGLGRFSRFVYWLRS